MPPESEYKLQFLILQASVYLLFRFTSKLEIPHLVDLLYRHFSGPNDNGKQGHLY